VCKATGATVLWLNAGPPVIVEGFQAPIACRHPRCEE